MEIVINGEPRQIDDGLTLAALLSQLDMQPPLSSGKRAVAVERNRELVPRGRHAECVLQPGDRLEIVTLVGGG